MKITEILTETTSAATCAGSIATVAQPMGGMIAREDNPTNKIKVKQPAKKLANICRPSFVGRNPTSY